MADLSGGDMPSGAASAVRSCITVANNPTISKPAVAAAADGDDPVGSGAS
jgi:hypothetical protein